MGRPPLGPAKKSRTIAIHVTEAEYQLILTQGKPSIWARRAVLDALTQPPDPTPTTSQDAAAEPDDAPPAPTTTEPVPAISVYTEGHTCIQVGHVWCRTGVAGFSWIE